MTKIINHFLEYLLKNYLVFAPQRLDSELVVAQITNPKAVELTNELPLHSFKSLLVPSLEALFNYENKKIKLPPKLKNQVIFGLTIPDLKAITTLNQVFAKDPYYQERIKKTIIVGHSLIPKKRHQFFLENFSEDILEHLKFDIFLLIDGKNFIVYTGSEDGQKILDNFGYNNYQHIEFVGPIRESGPDQQMLKIRENFYKDKALWQELGKLCIECGKCTLICPLCFCFDIFDEPALEPVSGNRCRHWGCCFYTDFSEVAGWEIDKKKPKFLNTTAERLRFWYEHKFVRMPKEFSLMGCVGCGRCTKVCPVGIDIKENLQRIMKGKIK